MKWKRDLIEMRRERLAMPRIQASFLFLKWVPAHRVNLHEHVEDLAALWSEVCKAPIAG